MLATLFVLAAAASPASPPLELVQTIALPQVSGRIDHLAFDPQRHRLFVAALGNGTLEVVDVAAGRRDASVPGLVEPQGVAYLGRRELIIVANGGGTVAAFDAATLEPRARLDGLPDADNVRYDERADRLFVGYGGGALAVIDPQGLRKLADLPLPGHPESFRLAERSSRVFVNVPARKAIVVLDRDDRRAIATVPLGGSRAQNFPMTFDEGSQRLFVATRSPARVLVAGPDAHPVGDVACVGDADDLFYDDVRARLYVTGGEGFVDVFDASTPALRRAARVPSAAGARTSLWVPALSRLFVAAPARAGRDAAILVFQAPARGK